MPHNGQIMFTVSMPRHPGPFVLHIQQNGIDILTGDLGPSTRKRGTDKNISHRTLRDSRIFLEPPGDQIWGRRETPQKIWSLLGYTERANSVIHLEHSFNNKKPISSHPNNAYLLMGHKETLMEPCPASRLVYSECTRTG